MNIKHRIRSLPVISTIIFSLGVAASAVIATGADIIAVIDRIAFQTNILALNAAVEAARAASLEQSAGIEDIGRAIVSMDDMTQQHSALVEQASAAAESLTDQTTQLGHALAVFKLAETRRAPLALGRA
jgi:methyl-accepting chemotaxis protein